MTETCTHPHRIDVTAVRARRLTTETRLVESGIVLDYCPQCGEKLTRFRDPTPEELRRRACTHKHLINHEVSDDADWTRHTCTSCGAYLTKRKKRPGPRPGWLADDELWSDQLAALHSADRAALEREWSLAGGAPPLPDTSWFKMESAEPAFPPALVAVGLLFVVVAVCGPLLWLVAL